MSKEFLCNKDKFTTKKESNMIRLEPEVVEITWINATENYFNLMAKPLGLASDALLFKKTGTAKPKNYD